MNQRQRARRIRGALNAALIGLSVVLVAVAALYFYFDDPVTRMPPRASIPADLPPKLAANIEKLYSTDDEVRIYAMWGIGEFKEQATPAIPFLVASLGDDKQPTHRPDFNVSLAYLRDFLWPPPMTGMWGPAPPSGKAAAYALGQIGPPAVDALGVVLLRSRNPVARENAAIALQSVEDEQVRVGGFPEGLYSDRVTELLMRALQQDLVPLPAISDRLLMSDGLLPPGRLVEIIRNSKWNSRDYYGVYLCLVRDPRCILPVAAARTDRDIRMRDIALNALNTLAERCKPPGADGDSREESGVEPNDWQEEFSLSGFVELLHDANAKVRCCAVYAIGRWGQPAAEAPLASALGDPDSRVRLRAAYWLGQLGKGLGVEALVSALADKDKDVRLEATQYLGDVGDDRAIEPLVARLRDEDPRVRSMAVESLGLLSDDRAIVPLLEAEQDAFLHWAAINALARFDRSPALARYIAALRDPNPVVRSHAHRALVLISWEDFGEDADAWTAWWQRHKAEEEP